MCLCTGDPTLGFELTYIHMRVLHFSVCALIHSGVFHKLIEQLVICADVPELSIHVFQVMEEFWKSRQNDKDLMTTREVCYF